MAMCIRLLLLSVSFALFLISCWYEVVQKTVIVAIVIAIAYLVRYVYKILTYLLTWTAYLRATVTAFAKLPTTLQNGISDGYQLIGYPLINAIESGTTHMRCKLHQNANQFLQLANDQLMIHVRFISKAIPSPYVSQTVDDNVRLVTHVWEWIRALAIHSGNNCARQLFHLVQGLNGGMIESTENLRLEGDAAKKVASCMDSREYAERVLRALHAAKVRGMFAFKTQETQEVDAWVIVDPL
jgi:hypothetical protein